MSKFTKYKYVNKLSTSSKMKRLVWNLVWIVAFRTTPQWALHEWRRFLLISFGAKIGIGSKIAPSCRVWAPWNLEMGDYSVLAEWVDCYSMDRIIIGSKVAVSRRTFLCTGSHRTDSLTRPLTTGPIEIGDHVWIAAECFVHPDIKIGTGSIVGARSVVLRNLPEWSICSGNPCRPIKERLLSESINLA